MLESYVTRTRDKKAALAFIRKALKQHGAPNTITTDGLRSYGAVMRELGNADRQEVGRHANNRFENSHLPFRDESGRCCGSGECEASRSSPRFHANVHNHFASERHLVDRQTYKLRRSAALAEWQTLAS